MSAWRGIVGTLCLLAAFGCASPPTDLGKDRGVDLSKYKTYQWVSQNEVVALNLKDPKVDYIVGSTDVLEHPDVEAKIRDLIDRGLQQQGFQKVTDGKPDFYVTFYKKSKNEDWASTWHGYTRAINGTPVVIFPGYERDLANRARDGDFYVTFYDPHTGKPSWAGRVAITDQGPKLGTVEADQAMANLITEFKKSA